MQTMSPIQCFVKKVLRLGNNDDLSVAMLSLLTLIKANQTYFSSDSWLSIDALNFHCLQLQVSRMSIA